MQAADPAGHTHEPPSQDAPAGHALPHAPQLSGLELTSTHDAPHFVSAPHETAHLPALQTAPAPHVIPHPPQFIGSDPTSTHAPPHA